MLFICFFCTVTLIIFALVSIRDDKAKWLKKRLSLVTIAESPGIQPSDEPDVKEANVWSRMLGPVWREFKRSFKRRMPGEKEAKIEVKLLQAGRPFNMAPVDYRMLQMFLFVALPILFSGYGILLRLGTAGIIVPGLIGIATALFLPNFYLQQKIKQRSKLALRELPDVLDLLTVSLEAGLGFDAALGKLISKKVGVLAGEFHRCLEEIRLGKTRREALTGVRERIAVDEIRTLISSILQAEKLGIGMVQVLRVQSVEVREQRKQRAEEAAMKAPVKMMFPLVIFIFPSLFIVLLGPALIQFIGTFSN